MVEIVQQRTHHSSIKHIQLTIHMTHAVPSLRPTPLRSTFFLSNTYTQPLLFESSSHLSAPSHLNANRNSKHNKTPPISRDIFNYRIHPKTHVRQCGHAKFVVYHRNAVFDFIQAVKLADSSIAKYT